MILGAAPLTLARTQTGTVLYVYPGQPAVGLDEEDAARLIGEGFLVEVPDEVVPDVVPTPDDPGTGSPGTAPTTTRPKKTAPKAAWLAFRGVPEADAARFTVQELQDDELMDDWGRSVDEPGEVEHADGTRSDTLRDAVDDPDPDVVYDPVVVGQPVTAAAPDAS